MIELYCRRNHGTTGLCADCTRLLEYACERLNKCPNGNAKTSCRKCTVHCYSPHYRGQIREVMRRVGPLMLFKHPMSALQHLLM